MQDHLTHDPGECRALLQVVKAVVLDLETTGLTTWKDHPLSIGIRPIGVQTNVILFTSWCSQISIVPHRHDADAIRFALEPLARPDLTIVGQNIGFDLTMLRWFGVQVHGRVRDTEQMLRLRDQDRGRSRDDKHAARLDLQNGGLTPLNYRLKDACLHLLGLRAIQTPSTFMDGVPYARHVRYLCSDLLATDRLYHHLWRRLTADQRRWTDHQSSTLLKLLVEMSYTGLTVDAEFMQTEIGRLRDRLDEINREHERQHGSPACLTIAELDQLLHIKYGLPRLSRSVNANARAALAKYASLRGWPRIVESLALLDGWQALHSLVVRLADYRRKTTCGRIHTTFGMRQTSGRISSSKPNVQQIAKYKTVLEGTPWQTTVVTRNLVVAPPGRILVAADIDQADPRCLANDIATCQTDTEALRRELVARRRRRMGHRLDHYQPILRACRNPDYRHPTPTPLPPFDPDSPHPLVDDFIHASGDLYSQVATRISGEPITKDSPERTQWKIVFLALINGKAPAGIARQLNCSVPQAKGYIARFGQTYPDIIGILALRSLELALSGQLFSWVARYRRVTPIYWCLTEPRVRIFQSFASGEKYWWDVVPLRSSMRNLTCFVNRIWAVQDHETRWLIYTADRGRIGTRFYPRVDDRTLLYRLPCRNLQWRNIRRIQRLDQKGRPIEESRFNGMDAARRSAVNSVMQGGTADLLVSMMLRSQPVAHRYGARLLASIHDELLFDVPIAQHKAFIDELYRVLEATPGPGFIIPVAVTIKRGDRFGEMTDTEKPEPYIVGRARAPARIAKMPDHAQIARRAWDSIRATKCARNYWEDPSHGRVFLRGGQHSTGESIIRVMFRSDGISIHSCRCRDYSRFKPSCQLLTDLKWGPTLPTELENTLVEHGIDAEVARRFSGAVKEDLSRSDKTEMQS
jgi:DNA polymerase I-like protein with 3'-5' exonuclease and polymerase domains